MNTFKFLTCLYSHLRPLPGKWNLLLTPLRRLVRKVSYKMIPTYFSRNHIVKQKCFSGSERIIVSLTSFPKRIDFVWVTIQSLLHQSMKVDKIILWLSIEQFQSIEAVPCNLRNLVSDIFEIRLVENNYRSHKKYLYAFREFPDDMVILADDDIIYRYDLVEELVKAAKCNPNSVICNYGYVMQYENDRLLPYSQWQRTGHVNKKDSNFFFGSGGGTLFRPKSLCRETLNIKLARELTPLADDVWLNAMVRLSNLTTHYLNLGIFLGAEIEDNVTLFSFNENANDQQIANVRNYFIETSNINPFIRK